MVHCVEYSHIEWSLQWLSAVLLIYQSSIRKQSISPHPIGRGGKREPRSGERRGEGEPPWGGRGAGSMRMSIAHNGIMQSIYVRKLIYRVNQSWTIDRDDHIVGFYHHIDVVAVHGRIMWCVHNSGVCGRLEQAPKVCNITKDQKQSVGQSRHENLRTIWNRPRSDIDQQRCVCYRVCPGRSCNNHRVYW